MKRQTKWTEEEKQMLYKYYEDFGPTYLVVLFRQKGYNRKARVIGQTGRRLGLKYKGENRSFFKSGHVPVNKGKKMSREQRKKCKDTFFKKGNMPQNHTHVGDIRKRERKNRFKSDGTNCRYQWIKIAEPNKWELLHRHIWKKHHGAIPKSKIIVFIDNNPDSCVIENLEAITRKEHATRCHNPEKVSESWNNPSDAQVIGRMRIKDTEVKESIIKKPALIELVRLKILLTRSINKQLQK